jgi:hypothetical protein
MCVAENDAESRVIFAAGGLIWKKSEQCRTLALIRRTQHAEEWMLPKVDLDTSGPWSHTALCTKMNEKFGCEVILGAFAGCKANVTDGNSKLVLFWNMGWVRNLRNVDDLSWFTVSDALQRLKDPDEYRVLSENEAIEGRDGCLVPKRKTSLKSWLKSFWLSSSARRLAESLICYSIELKPLIHLAKDNQEALVWVSPALELLGEARKALKEGDEDRGWRCFLATQRVELRILAKVDQARFKVKSETIRQEALNKLESWRKERVESLLALGSRTSGPGHAPPTPQPDWSLEAVCEAAEILHDHFDNNALKRRAGQIQMVRLVSVALVMVGIFLALLLCPDYRRGLWLDPSVQSPALMVAVVFFGVIGASLSGLLSTSGDSARVKIPDLLFSFRVTLAKLVVGVLSSLAASVMLMSDVLKIKNLSLSTAAVLFVALAAGFSERLVVRTLNKAGDKS